MTMGKKVPNMLYFLLAYLMGIFIFSNTNLYAMRGPVWTLSPLTATTLTVPINASAIVQYKITNDSHKTHTLVMQSIAGIQQITAGPGVCASTFTLGYQQFCTLTLQIDGSVLSAPIIGGPKVCASNANNTPNQNACYQPSTSNQLNITPSSTPSTASIQASVSTLALSVNCPSPSTGCTFTNAALTGKARIITITNMSSTNKALAVGYSASALPAGTTIAPSSCGDIAPGLSCTLTITPGATPSAAPGDTSPVPITITIAGTNTNSVTTEANILTYGSVYQSGYVFAVDDTTPNTTSISGKEAALMDQSYSIPWQPMCADSSTCTTTNANSYMDGKTNTDAIITALSSLSLSDYAAGLCADFLPDNYTHWYLPALCEMSYSDDPSSPCGTIAAPTLQNMQSNLVSNGIGDLTSISPSYWSSTQLVAGDPLLYAIFNIFDPNGSASQFGEYKDVPYSVRCVRILST